MSVPLPDARLSAIRERVPSAVCLAAHPDEVDKGHVWVTGSLSGSDRCSACHLSQRALDSDEAVLLAEVDRLSTALERMTRERDLLDVSVRSARRTTDRLRQERVDAAQPRLLAEIEQLRAELTAWQSAQDAVMAVAEDANAQVSLAQVAKAHAHALLAAQRSAKEA